MIWVLLGLILLIYAVIIIAGARKRDTDEREDGLHEVSGGNVSVFMDRSGNIDVIPFSLNRLKRGRASDYPLTLRTPFSSSKLGMIIRKGLLLSVDGKELASEDLMKSLGFYDWKEYSRGKKSVSVTFRREGVVLNSTIHHSDGSYAFRVRGFEKILPARLYDTVLGDAVLELMKISK